MLKLLHTADWHLGHWLHELSREHEHAAFLDWLLEAAQSQEVDALLIAGDVFEQASPPVHAEAMWFDFLARARQRMPGLDIVVIGGNHDSPARLESPNPILRGLGIYVVGAHGADPDRQLIPLRRRDGSVGAWVVAVPFLRPADLPRPPAVVSGEVADPEAAGGARGGEADSAPDPLIWGVRQVYAQALARARQVRQPGQSLVAMGHMYMVGTSLSHLSERRILGGNLHALPVDIFPEDLSYVALGHMHKPQCVGGRDWVRYAGSPIPLAMNEARYRNQVCLVQLDGEGPAEVSSLEVPRAVDLWRVPAVRPAPLLEVLARLAELPERAPGMPEELRPYLEVRVALESAEPSLRRDIEQALVGKAPRLVKLEVHYTGDGRALSDALPGRALAGLSPEEVFLRRYARDHSEPPPARLLEAFAELVDGVQQGARR